MDTSLERRAVISDATQLGWVLSEIRAIRGRAQRDTANAVGMDRTQLAHLEAGRSGRYLANLLELLDHLGGTLVVEWKVPARTSDSAESTEASTRPASESEPTATSMRVAPRAKAIRSFGKSNANMEATQEMSQNVAKQIEAMQRAMAPTRALIEEISRSTAVLVTQEEHNAEAP
jgi:transcriptional regulator with XRE-family HTH domain